MNGCEKGQIGTRTEYVDIDVLVRRGRELHARAIYDAFAVLFRGLRPGTRKYSTGFGKRDETECAQPKSVSF